MSDTKINIKILKAVSTTNLSDACDRLGINDVVLKGIHAVVNNMNKVFGRVITVKLTTNVVKNPPHLGIEAVEKAQAGEIIVIANEGRTDMACWGGILSTAASFKNLAGVIIDGACRDVEEIANLQFPVYSKGISLKSARNRVFQEGLNVPVILSGIEINPGDILVADENGCLCIPQSSEEEILTEAYFLFTIENEMVEAIKSGKSISQVDNDEKFKNILQMQDEK